jgi:hypothetical protein
VVTSRYAHVANEHSMSQEDESAVREALAKEALRKRNRKRYPDRPKVKGEHYALWAWQKQGRFCGKLPGQKRERSLHRHERVGFPESQFAELEELGLEFVQWCAP